MNLHSANNKFLETNNEFVSGGGNAGFKCVKGYTTLTDESVTTVDDGDVAAGSLVYTDYIDANEIVVTFNGTRYTCEKIPFDGGAFNGYGAWTEDGQIDFTEYPFAIATASGDPIELLTATEGTYQIKIETEAEIVETTPCFEKAVKSLANILTVKFSATADPAVYEGDKTATEVKDVLESGGIVLFVMPPKGRLSTRIDIVNFITGNQYIEVQHEDNNTPDYTIVGENIEAYFD